MQLFCQGNGRNIVFREYSFRRANSLNSVADSKSSARNSESALWHTNNTLNGTHWALSPELGEGQKTHWVTVGFLYGAGAETLIFVTGTSGKYSSPSKKKQSQLCIPRKPREIGVWVPGAEIQTSAVDTRPAVWVSTAEKFFKIVLGETRNFSRKLRGSQRQLCIKTGLLLSSVFETVLSETVFGPFPTYTRWFVARWPGPSNSSPATFLIHRPSAVVRDAPGLGQLHEVGQNEHIQKVWSWKTNPVQFK